MDQKVNKNRNQVLLDRYIVICAVDSGFQLQSNETTLFKEQYKYFKQFLKYFFKVTEINDSNVTSLKEKLPFGVICHDFAMIKMDETPKTTHFIFIIWVSQLRHFVSMPFDAKAEWPTRWNPPWPS